MLQIHQVFTNVSKGAVAPHADLQKSFGASATQESIILEILQKGELQVGEKERNAKLEMVHNEVVSLVASMCVDPETKRVYTASMIEKALQELSSRKHEGEEGEEGKAGPGWHGVTDKKSSKAQALEAIKALVYHQPIAIARARMRLRIVCPKKTKEKVQEFVEEVEEDGYEGGNWECVGFVEPGRYKGLVDLVGQETKGKGRVEVLDTAVSFDLWHSRRYTSSYGIKLTQRIRSYTRATARFEVETQSGGSQNTGGNSSINRKNLRVAIKKFVSISLGGSFECCAL